MKLNYQTLVFLIFIMSFISCSKEKKEPYKIPENAIELIASNSGKTWKIAKRINDGTRMNMAGCFLSYRQTFFLDMTLKDNNGEHPDCGTTLMGNWEIIEEKGHYYIKLTSDQLPEVMNTDKNYKYFRILHISDKKLILQFKHKQFSRKTVFVDTFVPEYIHVKDREFHR